MRGCVRTSYVPPCGDPISGRRWRGIEGAGAIANLATNRRVTASSFQANSIHPGDLALRTEFTPFYCLNQLCGSYLDVDPFRRENWGCSWEIYPPARVCPVLCMRFDRHPRPPAPDSPIARAPWRACRWNGGAVRRPRLRAPPAPEPGPRHTPG